MSLGDFTSGFSDAMTKYIMSERQRQREAEDNDIKYQTELIQSLMKNPNVNPNILGRAVNDLATLHSAAGKARPMKKGMAGMMGATETPISQLLQSVAQGTMQMQGPTTEQVPRPVGEQIEMTRGAELQPLNPQALPQIKPGGMGGMDTVVPPAPVGPPPAVTPLQRAAKQAEMKTQMLPMERQPLLLSDEEIAQREGQAAGVKAGSIRSAQKQADLDAWIEAGGSPEEFRRLQLTGMRGGTALRPQLDEGGYFKVGDKVIHAIRKEMPDGSFQLVDSISQLPIPPDAEATFAPRPEADPKAAGDLKFGDVVRQMNEERTAAGKPPLNATEVMALQDKWQSSNAPRITVSGSNPNQIFGRTDKVRDDFRAEPITKRYNVVMDAVNFIQSLNVNTTNPADDQALIYAFAKAMDPDSVVREGEYATVQKYAQSWMDTFKFNANRVFANQEFLTPQARMNMKNTILQRSIPVKTQYENLRRGYSDIMRRAGGTDADLQPYIAESPNGKSLNDYRKTAVPAPPIVPMPSHR